MGKEAEELVSFSKWIARPQSLIALAALVLSVCGVFVAVYEAVLVRRQQRASVWPHVEVAASMTGDRVQVWVQNVGVGPARVQAAAVSHGGETREDWEDLIRQAGPESTRLASYYSLIDGRVLPRDSDQEVVFRVTSDDGESAPAVLELLRRDIQQGQIDVTLCYCSVFDECWTTSLQDVLQRSGAGAAAIANRAVDDCERAPRSAI